MFLLLDTNSSAFHLDIVVFKSSNIVSIRFKSSIVLPLPFIFRNKFEYLDNELHLYLQHQVIYKSLKEKPSFTVLDLIN